MHPLLPQIREEYGFSLDQTGLLATGFTLGIALTGVPAGYLLDRLSRKLIVIVSVVVYSLGTLAIPLATGFADMAVYRLIPGLVFYGFLGLYSTFLREELGLAPAQAAWAASLVGFGAMMALPVGWLADRYDQRMLLAVGFVGSSLTGLAVYRFAEGASAQYVLAFLMGAFASGVLFTNCTTGMQRAVRPEHVGRGAGLFMFTYYLAAAVSGLLFARLVSAFDWSGAGLVQVTLLPILGLAALALVDVRRMVVPPRR